MRFQETHHLHAVDRHQNGGKNPRPTEAIHRQRTFGFWRSNQQEGHQRQHRAHERIELVRLHVVLAEVVGDSRANIERHHPHRHIERGQDLAFKLFRHIKPGAGKAPGGIR